MEVGHRWSDAQLDCQRVCLCYLPLHHKVQKKISSGTGSPRQSLKKGCKMVVCVCKYEFIKVMEMVLVTPLRTT